MDDNGKVYWDCPGFNDNRNNDDGVTQDILNSLMIQGVINQTQKTKFVLVVAENSFQKKAANFIGLIKKIAKLFGNDNNIEATKASITLVVTQATKND